MAAHARAQQSYRDQAALRVTTHGVTDAGLVRHANEDAFGMLDLTNGRRYKPGSPARWTASGPGVLLLVSDGMGGARAGEVASAMSIEGMMTGLLSASRRGTMDENTLRGMIERVSRNVHFASQRPDRYGMGATLTAVLVQGHTAIVGQVGDSRAYLLRDGGIGQVTHDQSYAQLLLDAGLITPEEAEHSPRKNIVLQAMGQTELKVEIARIELRPGDRLLLCSDGLTNVVDDATIKRIASPPAPIVRACNELVTLTLDGGAPDNVTVVLADVA
jgi:PPM family protein phosphatase